MTTKPTASLNVWSPRPSAKVTHKLSDTVTLYGLPAILIKPIPLSQAALQRINESDTLIFTSQYAATHGLSQIKQTDAGLLLGQKTVIAIGEATRQALVRHGISVTLTAPSPFSSESLIDALKKHPKTTHKMPHTMHTIAVIGGENGRRYLQDALQSEKKTVTKVVCYKRQKNPLSTEVMVEFIEKYGINAILVTSCDIADAAVAHLHATGEYSYQDWPTFVLSERIATHLTALGFNHIITATNASQQALNETILVWWKHRISE